MVIIHLPSMECGKREREDAALVVKESALSFVLLDVSKKAGSVGGFGDAGDCEGKGHNGVVVGSCSGFAGS